MWQALPEGGSCRLSNTRASFPVLPRSLVLFLHSYRVHNTISLRPRTSPVRISIFRPRNHRKLATVCLSMRRIATVTEHRVPTVNQWLTSAHSPAYRIVNLSGVQVPVCRKTRKLYLKIKTKAKHVRAKLETCETHSSPRVDPATGICA